MLEIQETRIAETLPGRMYSCMACSASFSALSPLLVHQASHANNGSVPDRNQSPDPLPQISCSSCKTTFASKELLDQHHCNLGPVVVSTAAAASESNFICDCGDEFQDFYTMVEHKRTHSVEPLILRDSVAEETASNPRKSDTLYVSHNQIDLISNSIQAPSDHPTQQQSPQLPDKLPIPELGKMKHFTVLSSPVSHINSTPLVVGQVAQIPLFKTAEFNSLPLLTGSQDQLPHTGGVDATSSPLIRESNLSNHVEKKEAKSPKKTLKRMLVSAFMNTLPSSQVAWRRRETQISPKPIATVSVATPEPFRHSSVTQLRRLLSKHGNKVAAKRIGSPVSAGRIMNLIRTFLPVVVLETRQKLVIKVAEKGGNRCGHCQKVFHSINDLILHHALHKKEEILGCSCCKRLVINQTSVPFHHLCPKEYLWALDNPFSVGTVMSFSPGTLAEHGQKSVVDSSPAKPQQKKLFYCQHCKNSYTRLYNLKKHPCPYPVAQHLEGSNEQKYEVHVATQNIEVTNGKAADEPAKMSKEWPPLHKSVSVGTEASGFVKLERTEEESSPVLEAFKNPDVELLQKASKRYLPFISEMAKNQNRQKEKANDDVLGDASQSDLVTKLDDVGESEAEDVERNNVHVEENMEWWTVPVNESQTDALSETVTDGREDLTSRGPSLEDGVSSMHVPWKNAGCIPQAAQRRFVCRRCGKNYSRRFTLNQHQKVCVQVAKAPEQQCMQALSVKGKMACKSKERFHCLQCGKTFSRRYTLAQHKTKCTTINVGTHAGNPGGVDNKTNIVPGQSQGSSANQDSKERMLLLPPHQGAQENNTETKSEGWGIMSLPSVLPRKVTCECGSAFICPRLLFEHLQMHAQESYICPECGKNLNSWLSFEAHLRTHKRLACPKCHQTFSLRSSLNRHMTKNRCRASSAQKGKFACSCCGLEVLSYDSLKLHLQNSACRPPTKGIGCPVCMRTFSSVVDLQRHLISHNHQAPFRCLICQRTYPSLRSLKDHRRKVHRKMFVKSEVTGSVS